MSNKSLRLASLPRVEKRALLIATFEAKPFVTSKHALKTDISTNKRYKSFRAAFVRIEYARFTQNLMKQSTGYWVRRCGHEKGEVADTDTQAVRGRRQLDSYRVGLTPR